MKICEVCGREHDCSYGSGRFCSLHCRAVHAGKMTVRKKRQNGTLNDSMSKVRDGIKFRRGPAINTQPGGKCKFCGKECRNRNSFINHERLCRENPSRVFVSNFQHYIEKYGAWNKGLTKETDLRMAKTSKTLKNGYATGKFISYFRDGRDTMNIRAMLSSIRIKNLLENPEKNPYVIRRKKENFAELFFKNVFAKNKIAFKQEYLVGRYFLDFAFPDKKTYIEIDGEQHYWDKKQVEHDKVRTQELNNMGWSLICRVRWSHFQKLTNDEKQSFINGIISMILGD